MNLSDRALAYLKSLKRDEDWTSSETKTKEYLLRQNINPWFEFLKFQVEYSGYELTIKGAYGQKFAWYFLSHSQISKNEKLELEKAGDRLICSCGDHETAQITFFITDRGEICTLDYYDLPNILHSSFDKLVEEYALRNEIHNWVFNPYYYEVANLDVLVEYMSDYDIIEECSDGYSTWWKKNDIIAVKGVWLDRPDFYFHVYGKNITDCDLLIASLKRNQILK